MDGVIAVTSWANSILDLHSPWAYLLVGGLCFSESAFVIAFFIPGETALVFGGVLASEHRVAIVGMVGVAICSTTLGYFVGYVIGRAYGPRLLDLSWFRDRPGIIRTRTTIVERGSWAVVVARFIPFVRAFMPGVAGASGVDSRIFARANITGALPWGAGYTLLGFFAGQAYHRFVKDAASGGEFIAALLVVLFAVHRVHARRSARKRARLSSNS